MLKTSCHLLKPIGRNCVIECSNEIEPDVYLSKTMTNHLDGGFCVRFAESFFSFFFLKKLNYRIYSSFLIALKNNAQQHSPQCDSQNCDSDSRLPDVYFTERAYQEE